MILKFLKDNQTYNISELKILNGEQVKIIGKDIPAIEGGFSITYESGIVDNLYNQFTTIYEQTEYSITFTRDEKVYYTHLVYDAETGFVKSQVTNNEAEMRDAVLRFSGQGKEFVHPEPLELLDEDGFPMYKIVDGVMIPTTEEDKAPFKLKVEEETFEMALNNKLLELESACKSAITSGVDVEGYHYSYGSEDQTNIFNAVTLATQTDLAVPYHADGESCRLFTKEEIVNIYVAQETNLTHNITYHNQLKMYLKTLASKEAVEAIKYGETELTGDYLATYMMIMTQADEVIKRFIGV